MRSGLIGFCYHYGECALLGRSKYLNVIQVNFRIERMVVSWFRKLLTGLLLPMPGFESTPVGVKCVLDRAAQ